MVVIILKACALLFGLEETWESSKRYLLGDIKFLEKLIDFDVINCPPQRFLKLRKVYFQDPNFTRELIFKVS